MIKKIKNFCLNVLMLCFTITIAFGQLAAFDYAICKKQLLYAYKQVQQRVCRPMYKYAQKHPRLFWSGILGTSISACAIVYAFKNKSNENNYKIDLVNKFNRQKENLNKVESNLEEQNKQKRILQKDYIIEELYQEKVNNRPAFAHKEEFNYNGQIIISFISSIHAKASAIKEYIIKHIPKLKALLIFQNSYIELALIKKYAPELHQKLFQKTKHIALNTGSTFYCFILDVLNENNDNIASMKNASIPLDKLQTKECQFIFDDPELCRELDINKTIRCTRIPKDQPTLIDCFNYVPISNDLIIELNKKQNNPEYTLFDDFTITNQYNSAVIQLIDSLYSNVHTIKKHFEDYFSSLQNVFDSMEIECLILQRCSLWYTAFEEQFIDDEEVSKPKKLSSLLFYVKLFEFLMNKKTMKIIKIIDLKDQSMYIKNLLNKEQEFIKNYAECKKITKKIMKNFREKNTLVENKPPKL